MVDTPVRNLIQAQNHRGELDRDARSHQAKLSEDAKRADQDREAQVVAAAISAELVALVPGVQRSLSLLKGYKVILDAVGKADKSVKSPIVFSEFMTPIYDANVAKLGLLGASIASDVVTVYAMAKIKPKNTEDQFVAAGVAKLYEGLVAGFENWALRYRACRKEAASISGSEPRPGPPFG
jgi:hypothetical protein